MALFTDHLQDNLKDYRKTILKSGEYFILNSRRDLTRWTELLSAGVISRSDYEWLIRSRVNLAEMESLKQVGLIKAQIDELRMALTQSVIAAAFLQIGL